LGKYHSGLPEDGVTNTETCRRLLVIHIYMYLTYYLHLVGIKKVI